MRDIRQILEGVYFGNYFIDALLMLRNSMLLSVLTYNLEVSINLTKKDLKQLDEVDCFLLKKMLNLSSKSSRTLLHGELGIVSVEFHIKQKRILYLHHLLSSETESLAHDVLIQMIQNPKKGDWLEEVKNDLRDFDLSSDIEQIKHFSKNQIKDLVKKRSRETYFRLLLNDKSKLSKGQEIVYQSFEQQTYLKPSSNLTSDEMKKIMKIRIRDVDLKCNFPNFYKDKKCLAAPLCHLDYSNSQVIEQ